MFMETSIKVVKNNDLRKRMTDFRQFFSFFQQLGRIVSLEIGSPAKFRGSLPKDLAKSEHEEG